MKAFVTLFALALVLSPAASAEVKPVGTVLESICARTKTFPTSLEVCIAGVEGRATQYLAVGYIPMEVMPGGNGPRPYADYFRVTKVERKKGFTTYTAAGVMRNHGETRPMENIYTVKIKDSTQTGTLKVDGESYFGGEGLEFAPIAHTESVAK